MSNLALVQNEISQAKRSVLPDSWVEKLFQKMEDRYGDLWANRYGAFPRDRVMRTWAEDLGDLKGEEIAKGLEACKRRNFPPTSPEFYSICRPPIDFESSFSEAVNQMYRREQGEDKWSHPAIFFAAVTIGAFDIKNSNYQQIEKRWKKVLQAEMDKGEWQAIPPRAIALPPPAKTAEEQAKADEMIRQAAERMTKTDRRDHRAWIGALLKRKENGEKLNALQERSIAEAQRVAA